MKIVAPCLLSSNGKKGANGGLQLRRAITFQAEGIKLLEKQLSRRQLQGFVRQMHNSNASTNPRRTEFSDTRSNPWQNSSEHYDHASIN